MPRDTDDIICAAFALGAVVECELKDLGWVHGEVVANSISMNMGLAFSKAG